VEPQKMPGSRTASTLSAACSCAALEPLVTTSRKSLGKGETISEEEGNPVLEGF